MLEERVFKKAGIGERFVAFVLDIGIVLLLSLAVAIVVRGEEFFSKDFLEPVAEVFFLTYLTVTTAKWGATVGKKVLRLRVVDTSYKPIGWGKAFLREVIGKTVSSFFFNLGYLWALIDKRNQGWHDKIAGTFVVKLDKDSQLIPVKPEEERVGKGRKIVFGAAVLLGLLPVVLLMVFVFFYLFIAQPVQIKGKGMIPHYKDGEFYLVRKRKALRRNEVVVFEKAEKLVLGRVIGLPGEKVAIKNGKVYINNKRLDESGYLSPYVFTPETFLPQGEVKLAPDSFFILPDNRAVSNPRRWGVISKEKVIGPLWICYWNCQSQ